MLTEYASWRWCLLVNVPDRARGRDRRGRRRPREQGARGHAYDIPGAVLSTLGLVSLVYGFTKAAKPKNPSNPQDLAVQGWTASSTVFFLILAVVLLAAFVLSGDAASLPRTP